MNSLDDFFTAMKFFFTICTYWLLPLFTCAQAKDSAIHKNRALSTPAKPKPEILTNGFIDIMNSGQMNASARLFRLFIGEPGAFQLPVSLYSGVSANNANPAPQRINEPAALNLINPLTGIVNISVDGSHFFGKSTAQKITKAGIRYQAGEKALNSLLQPSLKSITYFCTYANAGLLFQTGAWERQDEKNMGVFWLLARYIVNRSNKDIDAVFPDLSVGNRWLTGFSLGCGIEINNVLNIKAFYYQYTNIRTDPFGKGIWHFSFNYSMR